MAEAKTIGGSKAAKPKSKGSKKISEVVLAMNKVVSACKRAETAHARAVSYLERSKTELHEAMTLAMNNGAVNQEDFDAYQENKDNLSAEEVGTLSKKLIKEALFKKTIRN